MSKLLKVPEQSELSNFLDDLQEIKKFMDLFDGTL
jgi:hypothetical protein